MLERHSTVSFDPDRPDFAPYGLTCVHWRPSPMRRPDHHNEVELNFVERGSVTYLLGGSKSLVRAGRLTAFWAAIPHQIIDSARNTTYFVATIPLPWFLQWRLPERLVQALLHGQLVQEEGESVCPEMDAHLFGHWEHDLQRRDAELERTVLLEMQARLMRLAVHLPAPLKRSARQRIRTSFTDVGLSKVERMACFIAQNYTQPLQVKQIGEHVKLHPNYAMGLFQRAFGTTLIDYLTSHRVSHAQRLLATSDLSVADVAFSSGFNSLSRFNDAFRRHCGCSPREYRKRHLIENTVR